MKDYQTIINNLQQAIEDYLNDKETTLQMEDAICDAIRFIEYHHGEER